jgi:hypothetical protein
LELHIPCVWPFTIWMSSQISIPPSPSECIVLASYAPLSGTLGLNLGCSLGCSLWPSERHHETFMILGNRTADKNAHSSRHSMLAFLEACFYPTLRKGSEGLLPLYHESHCCLAAHR